LSHSDTRWVYQWFIKQHEKHIEEEKAAKIPASLDLTPYRDQSPFCGAWCAKKKK
jgi:hypothetical protein